MKTYPCCDGEEKDAFHALWLCPAAKDVWGAHHLVSRSIVLQVQTSVSYLLTVWSVAQRMSLSSW
jgi:hypothetical protein